MLLPTNGRLPLNALGGGHSSEDAACHVLKSLNKLVMSNEDVNPRNLEMIYLRPLKLHHPAANYISFEIRPPQASSKQMLPVKRHLLFCMGLDLFLTLGVTSPLGNLWVLLFIAVSQIKDCATLCPLE